MPNIIISSLGTHLDTKGNSYSVRINGEVTLYEFSVNMTGVNTAREVLGKGHNKLVGALGKLASSWAQKHNLKLVQGPVRNVKASQVRGIWKAYGYFAVTN